MNIFLHEFLISRKSLDLYPESEASEHDLPSFRQLTIFLSFPPLFPRVQLPS